MKPLQTVLFAGHPWLQKQLSHFNQHSRKVPVCPPSLPPQLTSHSSAGPSLTSRCTLVLPEREQSTSSSEQHNLTPRNRLNVRDTTACNKIMLHFFPATTGWFLPVALSSSDGLEAFLKGWHSTSGKPTASWGSPPWHQYQKLLSRWGEEQVGATHTPVYPQISVVSSPFCQRFSTALSKGTKFGLFC